MKNSACKIIFLMLILSISFTVQTGYADIIRNSHGHIEVSFQDMVVNSDLAEEIAKVLTDQNQTVSGLQFVRVNFLPGTFSKIMKAVQSNPRLHELYFGNNFYSDDEAERVLIDTLRSTKDLSSFIFSGYFTENKEFWRELLQISSTIPAFLELGLRMDDLSDMEIELLVELLRKNGSLYVGNFAKSRIGVANTNSDLGIPAGLRNFVSSSIHLFDAIVGAAFNMLLPITGVKAKEAVYNGCCSLSYTFGSYYGYGYCCASSGEIAKLLANPSKTREHQNCFDGFVNENSLCGEAGSFRVGPLTFIACVNSEAIQRVCYCRGCSNLEPEDLEDVLIGVNFQEPSDTIKPLITDKMAKKEQEKRMENMKNFVRDFLKKDRSDLGEFFDRNLNNLKEFVEGMLKSDLSDKLKGEAGKLLDVINSKTSSINPKFAADVIISGLAGGALGYGICYGTLAAGGLTFGGPGGAAAGMWLGQFFCPLAGACGAATGGAMGGNQYYNKEHQGGSGKSEGKTQGAGQRTENIDAVAQKIANGHAYEKHVLGTEGKIPGIKTKDELAAHVKKVMSDNNSIFKELKNGRSAYWHEESKTVVINDPGRADGGTVFRSSKRFFDNNLE